MSANPTDINNPTPVGTPARKTREEELRELLTAAQSA